MNEKLRFLLTKTLSADGKNQYVYTYCAAAKDILDCTRHSTRCRSSWPSGVFGEQYGYEKALHPLVQDLKTWEKYGVFVEQLGECVKGTVPLYLLIILVLIPWQDFKRTSLPFFMVKRNEIQQKDVLSGGFEPRMKQNLDRLKTI